MKRTKIIILLLLVFVLLSGSALADDNNEETDEDIPYIEITEGEIEFKVDIFGYDKTTTEEEVDDDYDEEETEYEDGNLITIDEGEHSLALEVAGNMLGERVDWNLKIDTEEDEDTELTFVRGFENTTLELASTFDFDEDTLWSTMVNEPEITANREIGNLEGQAKIRLVGTDADVVEDEDTYISYDIKEELNLGFKPYEADFEIGDEFERDIEETQPGVEAAYELNDDLTIAGTLWTVGDFEKDEIEREPSDGDYWEDDPYDIRSYEEERKFSQRDIANKIAVIYDLDEDSSITAAGLIERASDSTETELETEFEDDDIDQDEGFYEEENLERRWGLNISGDYKIEDNLSSEGELLYSRASTSGEEEKLIERDGNSIINEFEKKDQMNETELGLYGKITADLDRMEVYGSYKWLQNKEMREEDYEEEVDAEEVDSDGNPIVEEDFDDFTRGVEETNSEHEITAGVDIPVENELTWNIEGAVRPRSYQEIEEEYQYDYDEEEEDPEDGEFDWSEVDSEDYSELDFRLITKLIYEF